MSDNIPIESMPLYTHLDRIDKGLAALGIGPGDPIQPEQLFALDQWHYNGIETVRLAADYLALHSASRGPTSALGSVGRRLPGPYHRLPGDCT